MLDNIRSWFIRNQLQISWFIIGWMTLQGLDALGRGQLIDAGVAWFLAAINYALVRR